MLSPDNIMLNSIVSAGEHDNPDTINNDKGDRRGCWCSENPSHSSTCCGADSFLHPTVHPAEKNFGSYDWLPSQWLAFQLFSSDLAPSNTILQNANNSDTLS